MERVPAALFRLGAAALAVECIAHGTRLGGRPSYYEVYGLAVRLSQGEVVALAMIGARAYPCQVLHHPDDCAVIATI